MKYPEDWNVRDYYKEVKDDVLLSFTIFSDRPLPVVSGRVETLESIFVIVKKSSLEEARGSFERVQLVSPPI